MHKHDNSQTKSFLFFMIFPHVDRIAIFYHSMVNVVNTFPKIWQKLFYKNFTFYIFEMKKTHEKNRKMLNFFEKSLICLLFFIFCDKF